MRAEFIEDPITVHLPEDMGQGWKDNSTVGVFHEMAPNNGLALSLQVEKDFACLDERNENQADDCPNPKAEIAMKNENGV